MIYKGQKVPVGGYIISDGDLEYNQGGAEITIKVRNTGDRPIQIGSHFHFFEVNQSMEFDRESAFGCRLNIPATTAIRFEAGDEKEVTLTPYRGKQRVIGFNDLVDGWTGGEPNHAYRPNLTLALNRAAELGFSSKKL